MKRFCISALVLLLCVSACFATVFPNKLGAAISYGGRSDSMMQTALCFTVRPFNWDFFTPLVFGEAYVQLSDTSLSFGGFRAGLGLELFHWLGHPLDFMNANSTVLSPAVWAGINYESGKLTGYAQLSLVRMMEKDAVYEYLVPFAEFSKSGFERYGVLIFRFSGLF